MKKPLYLQKFLAFCATLLTFCKKWFALNTKRLVLDALLIAIYVVLGFWKIPIGNMLRVNLASFAVIICAVSFGPVDGLIVGFLGEFLSQVLGPFGITPTTHLWALPEAARGFSLGLIMLFLRKGLFRSNAKKGKYYVCFLTACILTGIVSAFLNTYALYVDSTKFGYYNYYMVYGVLYIRLAMAVVLSGLFGYIALPITSALRRNKLI